MAKTDNRKGQAEFLILLSLLDGQKHGYEIAKFIEEKSNGFFRMPFGTLYPLLHRLEREGLVDVVIEIADPAKPRKVYRLTKLGRSHSQNEVKEFQSFSKAMGRMVPT